MKVSPRTLEKLTDDEAFAIEAISVSRHVVKYLLGAIAVALIIIWTWRLISPRYVLYQANIERQVQVADARAKSEAATLLADSEIERAKGVAEANRIIADSITPEYTTWLYVDQLDEVVANGGQIIYIPTEAGIPILEAGQRQP